MKEWWERLQHRLFGPTYARAYAAEWAAERRLRQHAPFVVDRLDLFTHGIDEVHHAG